tara:strand:+ start:2215 stop:3156 length:942 start_codon:yes stop_codon:yes gene_type:complete
MSFLNKFQYHYHSKYLDGIISSKKYSEVFSYLEKLTNDKKIFHDLSLKFVNQAINKSNQDCSKNRIVWINSYLTEDNEYIISFIENYISKISDVKQNIKLYQEEISEILLKPETIDFNTLVNQSYFFQWMILNRQETPFKFIANNLPFFSSEENFNFTKSNITQAYIFVINNPYNVYSSIKEKNNNDQEIARNVFLNLDEKSFNEDIKDTSFHLSKKGWHTNTLSWTDANVINSLKGKIISKKELLENTYDVLSSIILHLIQSGVEIDLNYDLIDQFVKINPPKNTNKSQEISQKEKKFLNSYVEEIADLYDI